MSNRKQKVDCGLSSLTDAKPNVSRSFILQTAADYDMDVTDVEKIYNDHSGYNFYIELEKFIEHRSQYCG